MKKAVVIGTSLGVAVFFSHQTSAELTALDGYEIPTVITATKLKQARTVVPAAVTIISRKMIEASGIRELPELFRLVPGMAVGERDGWNYIVGQHGAYFLDGRRMQVLIDGRPIHPVGFSIYRWSDIPLAIEDIEKIEVTRGPNSASYGANSSIGVINIFTSHPDDTTGTLVKAVTGSESTEEYLLRHSKTFGQDSFRLTAKSRHDSGFDSEEQDYFDPLDLTKIGDIENRDSKSIKMLNARWIHRFSEKSQLDAQVGYSDSTKQEKRQLNTTFDSGLGMDVLEDFYINGPNFENNNYFASVKSTTQFSNTLEFSAQLDHTVEDVVFEFSACTPDVNLGLPANNLLACGDLDESIKTARTDLQLQTSWVINPNIRTVSGLTLHRYEAESQTYFRGDVAKNAAQLFGNVEIKTSDSVNFNLGGSIEKEQGLDFEFSPRIAANYLITEQQSFRLVYARAHRTPDLIETDGNWNLSAYNMRFFDPATNSVLPGLWQSNGLPDPALLFDTTGNPDLESEPIVSWQAGYYANFRDLGLELDINYFKDKITDMIYAGVTIYTFTPINQVNGKVEHEGVEIELTWQPHSDIRLYSGLAFIETDIKNANPREKDTSPHFTGSLQADWLIQNQSRLSATYYYADEINEFTFQRLDLRYAHTLQAGNTDITIAPVLQYRFDNDPEYFRDNMYDNSTSMMLEVSAQF